MIKYIFTIIIKYKIYICKSFIIICIRRIIFFNIVIKYKSFIEINYFIFIFIIN